MSIWSYDSQLTDPAHVEVAIGAADCVFCDARLEIPRLDRDHTKMGETVSIWPDRQLTEVFQDSAKTVKCCPVCGWWTVKVHIKRGTGFQWSVEVKGAAGVLKPLDVADRSAPLAEIRKYLAARYEERFYVDPWRFEEVVAGVYGDLGFRVRVTGKSNDGGIDVVLDGPDGTTGVQVKRYKGKISVEQIRAFCGALYLEAITRGIFVTTSTFAPGASVAAGRAALRGMPIQLVDAKQFYEALGLAQRAAYRSTTDPTAPFSSAQLIDLDGYIETGLA